jgi:hypothetical protein
LAIPNYIIPINKGKREKRKNNFFSMIHINKKKEKKGENLFCFVCMILLLIYMCLCLVIKMNCMYTWWVDCSMSYVNCHQTPIKRTITSSAQLNTTKDHEIRRWKSMSLGQAQNVSGLSRYVIVFTSQHYRQKHI